ncbi:hypothetical protein DFH09DRAFT_1101392 [Mycena vulgaris]|nr:hypothetical protein DFH09DRAFT_1101392 [Mycena vulgaris]
MRSVEHGAGGANGCVPLAAIASDERDSRIGFVLCLESGHGPTLFRKPREGRGCLEEDICILSGKVIVSVLKTGYRYLNKISKSEKRRKYSCTYRYSGAGSEDESRGTIRIGNEQLRDSGHQVRLGRRAQ